MSGKGLFYNIGAGLTSALMRARTPQATPAPAAPRVAPPSAPTAPKAQPPKSPMQTFAHNLFQRGVDVKNYVQRMVMVESGGRATAANPNSTAVGLAQFIESTWLAYIRKYFPEYTKGRTREQILALRTDPTISLKVAEAFTLENAKRLNNAKVPINYGTLYLAHFAGAGTAVKILKAKPSTPVVDIVGQAAVKANPTILQGKTAGQVVAWANNKMGVA